MIIKEKYYRDIISSKIAIGALALMSIFPRIGHAGDFGTNMIYVLGGSI